MADQALVVRSDRLGVTVLRGNITNQAAGDHFETFSLPAGFGDCLVTGVTVYITGITTATLTYGTDGCKVGIYDVPGAVNTDFVTDGLWVRIQAGAAAVAVVMQTAHLVIPVLCREAERVALTYVSPESTTTGDLELFVRVKRLRNV